MESIQDPKNIVGISSLIDSDDINSDIDVGKLEQEIIRGAKMDTKGSIDHAEEYKKEMERITQTLNLPNAPKANTSFTIQDDDDYDDDVMSVASHAHSHSNSHSHSGPSSSPRFASALNANGYSNGYSTGQSNSYSGSSSRSQSFVDPQMRTMTQEEKKQVHISRVLGDIDDRELEGIDKERDEDTKTSLLEQIDILRTTLDDDGIDVKNVPIVDKNHSVADIQNVYKILRLKNDRNRYCSFAEELILAGAYGLESLFDGEKVWFGNYRPDLVGWSSTVKVKLRRMRYETSTFVGEIMQEYQMSAGVRLALELLPSCFLYSRQKKISNNDNFVGDSSYKDAISQLNSLS